jgi:hypothetical protein
MAGLSREKVNSVAFACNANDTASIEAAPLTDLGVYNPKDIGVGALDACPFHFTILLGVNGDLTLGAVSLLKDNRDESRASARKDFVDELCVSHGGNLLGYVSIVQQKGEESKLREIIVDSCEVVYTFLMVEVQVNAGFAQVPKEWASTSVWALFAQVLVNGLLEALVALLLIAGIHSLATALSRRSSSLLMVLKSSGSSSLTTAAWPRA